MSPQQFANLMEFVLIFDEYKMLNPIMQNDISYFRRTTQAQKRNGEEVMGNSESSRISYFFAEGTPMLKELAKITREFALANQAGDLTTEILGTMAKVCQKMLDSAELRTRLQNQKTELFILRVMVGLVILYDHVHPAGAFAKGTFEMHFSQRAKRSELKLS